MDIHTALEKVAQWCAQQTAAGDPDRIELDCHATVWITIGEAAPPWWVRWERRSTAGASAPVAQLRYDPESREWALHHGERARGKGWCDHDDAIHGRRLGPLLNKIADDRAGRFEGLPPGYEWTL